DVRGPPLRDNRWTRPRISSRRSPPLPQRPFSSVSSSGRNRSEDASSALSPVLSRGCRRCQWPGLSFALDIKLEEQHVAVLHHVVAALVRVMPVFPRAPDRAGIREVLPVHALGLDEAAL